MNHAKELPMLTASVDKLFAECKVGFANAEMSAIIAIIMETPIFKWTTIFAIDG